MHNAEILIPSGLFHRNDLSTDSQWWVTFRQWKLIALATARDGEIEGLQTISP